MMKHIKKAQTFAIRCTIHHKSQMYMEGNLRPFGCSSNNICSLVVDTVVIVQLSSFMSAFFIECRCKSTHLFNNDKETEEKTHDFEFPSTLMV